MLFYLEIFTVINVLAITLNFMVMCVTRENKKTILINTLFNIVVTAILMGISCLLSADRCKHSQAVCQRRTSFK